MDRLKTALGCQGLSPVYRRDLCPVMGCTLVNTETEFECQTEVLSRRYILAVSCAFIKYLTEWDTYLKHGYIPMLLVFKTIRQFCINDDKVKGIILKNIFRYNNVQRFPFKQSPAI